MQHMWFYCIYAKEKLPWNNVDEHYDNYCGVYTNNIVTGERGIRLNMRINI